MALDPNITVFAVSFNPEYDYTDSSRFGNLVFMTKGYVLGQETDTIVDIFSRFAATATENDYLLLSGTTLLCSLAVAAWIRTFNSAKLLYMTPVRDKVSQQTRYLYQLHYVTDDSTAKANKEDRN